PEPSPLSLHDALPILAREVRADRAAECQAERERLGAGVVESRPGRHRLAYLAQRRGTPCAAAEERVRGEQADVGDLSRNSRVARSEEHTSELQSQSNL